MQLDFIGFDQVLYDNGNVAIGWSVSAQAMYGRITDMDNLNKRLGEARFIDQEDGLWVRLRYDRMGKDDQFRLRGKTAELGYDWKKNPEETNSKPLVLMVRNSPIAMIRVLNLIA